MLIKIFFPVTGTLFTADSSNTFREVAQLEISNDVPVDDIFGYCQNGILLESKYPRLLLRSLSVGDVIQISNTNRYIMYENFGIDELSELKVLSKTVENTTDKDVEDFIRMYDRCRLHLDSNHVATTKMLYDRRELSDTQFFGTLLSMVDNGIITDSSLIIILNQFITVSHPCMNQFFELDYTKVTSLAQLEHVTERDIFLTVRDHLYQQFELASNDGTSDGYCMYKTEEGLKCAAGCMISNEEYSKSFENENYKDIIDTYGFPHEHKDLIGVLQDIHDSYDPLEWSTKLENLRKEFNIVL